MSNPHAGGGAAPPLTEPRRHSLKSTPSTPMEDESGANHRSQATPNDDVAAIRAVVADYTEGVKSGDEARLHRAFHPGECTAPPSSTSSTWSAWRERRTTPGVSTCGASP
ncbi:nuclear transport factor 2 family protein [Corallococcus sp. NCSPR001]|nr:nuclear transport factor 2 family protein [Corallococcus sp. NCSPR001]